MPDFFQEPKPPVAARAAPGDEGSPTPMIDPDVITTVKPPTRPWLLRKVPLFWALLIFIFTVLGIMPESQFSRSALPVVVGLFLLYLFQNRSRQMKKQPLTTTAKPGWNLFLLLGGLGCIILPRSQTLQNIGFLPFLIFTVLLVGLLRALRKPKGPEIGAVTASVGLVIFVWLWELAGRNDLAILPVDLPEVHEPRFTAEGVAKALVTEIESWPPRQKLSSEVPFLLQTIMPGPNQRRRYSSASSLAELSKELGVRPPFRWSLDARHVIGPAAIGGLQLQPVYHVLRHLRHKRTLEAQMLIGPSNSWTLALRGSDLPEACFSDGLPQKLLDGIETGGYSSLASLRESVESDLREQRRIRPECGSTWRQRMLRLLGLSEIPTQQERRVSNVTVMGSGTDEELTDLVRRSLLEGMGQISPALLGLYYDRGLNQKKSALFYYRRALPQAVLDSSSKDPIARRTLVKLLMRIADLETRPSKEKERCNAPVRECTAEDGKEKDQLGCRLATCWERAEKEAFDTARKYYMAATSLAGSYAAPHLEYGDFILSRTRVFESQEFLKLNDSTPDYEEAIKEFLKASDLLKDGKDPEVSENERELQLSVCHREMALARIFEASSHGTTNTSAALDDAMAHISSVSKEMREKDPDYSLTQLYVTLSRSKETQRLCAEDAPAFGRAVGSFLSVNTPEEVLTSFLAFDRYRMASQVCPWYRADLGYYFFLAWFSYKEEGFAESARELGAREKDFNLFSWMRGQALWAEACDQEEQLEEGDRTSLFTQARSELKTSVDRESHDPDYLSSWARFRAFSSSLDATEASRALADAQRALAMRPGNPKMLVTLGLVQLRMSKLQEAVKNLSAAAELIPNDPGVQYDLGLAFRQHGEIEQAENAWRYVRSLDPQGWGYTANPFEGCGPKVGLQ